MKILIDCRSAGKPQTGIGMYINGLVSHLKNTENQYILLCYDKYNIHNLNGLEFKYLRVKRRNKHFENQIVVPYMAYKEQVDLFHVTHHDVFPILYLKKVIISVMDIFWIDHENESSPLFKFLFYSLSRIAFHRANHIITISNHTKLSLEKKMDINPKKVEAILISCHEKFSRTNDRNIRYLDNVEPYIFYNGSSAKRKNLKIFEKIDDKLKDLNVLINFVLVTKKTGKFDEDLSSLYDRKNFIIDSKDYRIDELREFYTRSLAFIFPSKYEGFGLPVLEAIKCGTIPIISKTTSLPEIVLGDSDFIVDPEDYEAISEKIIRIINDVKYKEYLRKKLNDISESFNWTISSSRTELLYEL